MPAKTFHWNEREDLEALRADFSTKRRVSLPNALSASDAELLFSSISDVNEGRAWYHCNRGDPEYYRKDAHEGIFDFHYRFDKFPLANIGMRQLVGAIGDARRADYRDLLQYGDRPENELPSNHPLRRFASFLDSDAGIGLLSDITDHSFDPGNAVMFLSRYKRGDYLSVHDDADPLQARSIAFVLGLSKDWLPHWGGQTCFFSDEGFGRSEAILPEFNSLTLFEVPMRHCVLPISSSCLFDRYSITGWFMAA